MKGKEARFLAPWRWVLLIALFLGLSVGTGYSQSLAELAKKEKQRRSKLGSQEKVRVITDRELRSQGGLPETRVVPQAGEEGGAAKAADAEADETGEAAEKEQDETKTREYWQKRVQAVKKKIQDLEGKLNNPDMNWGGGIRNDVNPLGQRNLSQRQELEKQLAQARAELQGIQDEARRAGVPPGWVR